MKESSLVLGKLQRAVLAARPVLMPDPDGLPGQFIQDPWQPPFYPGASIAVDCERRRRLPLLPNRR